MGIGDEMDAMLARPPADILEQAYEHIRQRRQIELGLYTVADLMALIILDAMFQAHQTMRWEPIN